jgi:hypothetical protein
VDADATKANVRETLLNWLVSSSKSSESTTLVF